MRSSIWILTLIGVATSSFRGTAAHESNPSRFTYFDDVRPILAEHCGSCHVRGGVAPMSLLEFQEAVPWANAIKMQVLQRSMPPWLPADGTGPFRHARGLSAEEVDIIVDWAVGETPEGEPSETPSSDSPRGWNMGKPDRVLDAGEEVVLGEDDFELEKCVVFETDLERSRLASQFELLPGSPTIVRRATIFLGGSCDREKHPLSTWLPGQSSSSIPVVLPQGTELAASILYRKGWAEEGQRIVDRSQLGLRFSEDMGATRSIRVNEPRHVLRDAVQLVAVYPDPQDWDEAEPFRVEVTRPDGQVTSLLVIEHYQPDWREKYVFVEPIPLPPGSELRLSQPAAWFDFTLNESADED